MRHFGLSRTSAPWIGMLVVAALAVAAWEGTIVQSSGDAHWTVLAVIALALVSAARTGRARQRVGSGDWVRQGTRAVWRDLTGPERRPAGLVVGTAAWVVLAAATIGWDLNSFVHQSHNLPTLSRIVGDVTRYQWGRALVFALWLALGTYLVVGGRRLAGTSADGTGAVGTGAERSDPERASPERAGFERPSS